MNFTLTQNSYYHLIGFVLFFLFISSQTNAQSASNGTVGLFQSQQIVGNVGIGTLNPGQALDVQGTARATAFNVNGYVGFTGAAISESDNTVYQAATDGFVACNTNGNGSDDSYLYTDSSNPPTTLWGQGATNGGWQIPVTALVKKNDYYECSTNAIFISMYFRALGS